MSSPRARGRSESGLRATAPATRSVPPKVFPPEPLPPKIGFFQRVWLFYAGELVFSIMEPWEIMLVHTVFLSLFGVLAYSIFAFLPAHLRILTSRAHYYLYGDHETVGNWGS